MVYGINGYGHVVVIYNLYGCRLRDCGLHGFGLHACIVCGINGYGLSGCHHEETLTLLIRPRGLRSAVCDLQAGMDVKRGGCYTGGGRLKH